MEYLRELKTMAISLVEWSRRNVALAFLLAVVAALIVYFFGFVPLYAGRSQSIWTWAWLRYLPQYNQEHSKLIPLAIIFLLWYHRKRIAAAAGPGSNFGLIALFFGVAMYVVAARALQPRVALFGMPFLFYGIVMFVWGTKLARVLFFPIALLFFMIPLGAIEQMTFRLQFLIIGIVKMLSSLCGIALYTVGTTIQPVNNAWGFDIAEGCSGIRSLIAMIMITMLFVHLCEPVFWKKIVLVAASVLFAVIGNAGRIFTITLIAQMGYPKFAGGIYHDWSSQLIFFPIALASMLGFAKLLNFREWWAKKVPLAGEKKAVVYDY
ncbi:MAG: exosortase/archaeosortase family protein [Verrucomicrobiota bacterium]|nr:exosortase/archaeosortase family protein [Verrucomicrobiota bacterium]